MGLLARNSGGTEDTQRRLVVHASAKTTSHIRKEMDGPTDCSISIPDISETKPESLKPEMPPESKQRSEIVLVPHEDSNDNLMLSKESIEDTKGFEELVGGLDGLKGAETESPRAGEEANVSLPASVCEAESREILVEPGEWVRPLGNLEAFMALGGTYGTLNTVQGVWLSSTHPILPEDVRFALTQVARQTHVLQLCVVKRRLWPWFRRMKHLLVPFKVELDDVMTVYYKIQKLPYNMAEGPLWRARLVPLRPLSPTGRYEAVLVISAHHCITDGLTNMVLCRDTLEVLNAIMSGRQYTVTPRLVIPFLAEEETTTQDWWYAFKYFCTKLYGSLFTDYSKKLYFNGALKQPATKVALTKILCERYTVEATQQLFSRCKEAKVTVHACILAVASLAILRVAQQNSPEKLDSALINGVNCVNMRRYYPRAYKESPGCHISLEEREVLIHSSDASSKENFWRLAKFMHDDLKKSLNVDKTPIRNCPFFRPSTLMLHINHGLTRKGYRHRTDSHFVTTNMGDLWDLLPGKYGDGPVEITHLLRSVSSELTGNPFTLVFHTFLQHFMISVDYYTTKVTDEVAALFFSTLTSYISNIATHGTVLVDNNKVDHDPVMEDNNNIVA
nr:uncharacterized protein LOC128688596 isoform X2 [Cherax quadricarinatus]